VPAAGVDARFVVYGALDYASGRLVWQTADGKDGATFAGFLDRVAAAWPEGPLVVVLDNAGYHKGRVARAWWDAHRDRVRPLWQPPYAPHLNLVERVWRHLKDRLACHRHWDDLAGLRVASEDLLARTTANFHDPDRGIRLRHNFCQPA
jgi:transposase